MRNCLSFLSFLAVGTTLYADLPPLIDRDSFFGEIKITAAQISPDGRYISFLKPYNGTRNIWVKRAEEPFSAAKPMSAETKRPVANYFWSRDSKYLLYVQDQAGDENYNVYAVNPGAAPDKGSGVPPVRNISEAKGSRAMIYDLPKSDSDILHIGLNDRDKSWHDLYKLRISTGERTLMRKNTARVAQWLFDNAAALRVALRTDDKGNTEILRVDADKFTPVYSCDIFESCNPVHFDHSNQELYFLTNKGPNVDRTELSTLNPNSGSVRRLESDPMKRVDLKKAMFSDVDDRLLATVYADDKQRIDWRDKDYEADYRLVQSRLPGREIEFRSHTADESEWIITAQSDVEPGEVYLFDRRPSN